MTDGKRIRLRNDRREENEKPVRTKAEALKRTRSATVVYYAHLGYVGGGNYNLSTEPIPSGNLTYDDYYKKVNDYNVLRNHHYTYTLKVAGVENIKLEATREDQGNILEQEKQPGAEGTILESQHFYDLDSHYETRNVTIDFTRLPQDYTKGFSFTIDTPFDKLRATLKKSDTSDEYVFVDKEGKPMESIRNHDWDWIHFAWYGTPQDPYRSLIDPFTGNGISYSETYGGYEHQQTYNEDYLKHNPDATHKYPLLNSLEFSRLVWNLFVQWVKDGKSEVNKTVTSVTNPSARLCSLWSLKRRVLTRIVGMQMHILLFIRTLYRHCMQLILNVNRLLPMSLLALSLWMSSEQNMLWAVMESIISVVGHL